MRKLNYILIDRLPGEELRQLTKNIEADREDIEERKKVDPFAAAGFPSLGRAVFVRLFLENPMEHPMERLSRYPAEESILVSGDGTLSAEAASCGMATVFFLPGEGDAKEHPTADMYVEGFAEVGLQFLLHAYERHHQIPWTILVTERCVVREFSIDRLDDLFALYSGEGMTDYIEPLYPYEKEKEYQEAYIRSMYRFYGYGMWIVCDKETDRLIGRAGIECREELGGEVELGYAIGTADQNKGYATEVCRAILSYIKEELAITSVCCLIEEGNAASEHLAEKIGFSYCQTLEIGGKTMKKYEFCIGKQVIAHSQA